VRQGLIDMEAMFTLLETKPRVAQAADAVPLLLPASVAASVAAAFPRGGAAATTPTAAAAAATPLLDAVARAAAAAGGGQPPLVESSREVMRQLRALAAQTAQAAPQEPLALPLARAPPPPPLTAYHIAAAPALEYRRVSFHYSPDRRILDDVSFAVPTGSTAAVVGPSGCGKSTLLRLAFRFFDVDPGGPPGSGVYVHGQDVRRVTLPSLRAAIGVVPQDTVLFNDTIAANIAYGDLAAPREDVLAAAAASHIHDTIAGRFARGYDTVVGERGLKLSGGEKQRVAIARLVLKNAPLLLCDEATSALDTATEAGIMATLGGLAGSSSSAGSSSGAGGSTGRTLLLVAHRLSTVRHADNIVVLDRGRVVEQGPHDALLRLRGGLYASMWDAQRRAAEKQQQAQAQQAEGGGTAAAATPAAAV
jgi:ABC-type transport system involved in Fe-S cluster assembly fused permease/ATPase subunit